MNIRKVIGASTIGAVILYLIFTFCPPIARGDCLQEYRSKVGSVFVLKIMEQNYLGGRTYACTPTSIVYTGMVGTDTFALQSPRWNTAVNVFYPAAAESIEYRSPMGETYVLKILHVTPKLLTVEVVSVF